MDLCFVELELDLTACLNFSCFCVCFIPCLLRSIMRQLLAEYLDIKLP